MAGVLLILLSMAVITLSILYGREYGERRYWQGRMEQTAKPSPTSQTLNACNMTTYKIDPPPAERMGLEPLQLARAR